MQRSGDSQRISLTDWLVRVQPWHGERVDGVDCYDMEGFECDEPFVRTADAIPGGAQCVHAGDVLVSIRSNAPRRAWVVGEARGRPQIATADWLVLRSDAFEPTYVRHLLVSNEFELCCRQTAPKRPRSQTTPSVMLEGITLALPSKEVQKRSASILDHADSLRAKRVLVVERSRELMASLFDEQFGASPDAKLPVVSLGSLLHAPACRGVDATTDAQGRFPLVRATDLHDGSVHLKAARYVSRSDARLALTALADGDVLVAREPGSTLQRVAIARPGDAVWFLHSKVWRLRPDGARVMPEYLQAWLNTLDGQSRLVQAWLSTGARGQTAQQLAGIALPLPAIEAQHRFAERIRAVEAIVGRWNASAQRLDALLGTLRDLAYRGELALA